MSETAAVLKVETPHFAIRLYETMLKIDLRGGFKNEIEEALENKPVLKETIGSLLGLFVPLHIRLSDIDSVLVDKTGKMKINLPLHRKILIPLERNEAERLVATLNQLITKAKNRKIKEEITKKRTRKSKKKLNRAAPSSYTTVPYYFPTEQIDIVNKLGHRKRRKK